MTERLGPAEVDGITGLGAGGEGGRIVFEGTPAELWAANTPSGVCLSGLSHVHPPGTPSHAPRPSADTHARWVTYELLRSLRQMESGADWLSLIPRTPLSAEYPHGETGYAAQSGQHYTGAEEYGIVPMQVPDVQEVAWSYRGR